MAPQAGARRIQAALIVTCQVVGSVFMWSLLPLAWLWIGGQIYTATDSFLADGALSLGVLPG